MRKERKLPPTDASIIEYFREIGFEDAQDGAYEARSRSKGLQKMELKAEQDKQKEEARKLTRELEVSKPKKRKIPKHLKKTGQEWKKYMLEEYEIPGTTLELKDVGTGKGLGWRIRQYLQDARDSSREFSCGCHFKRDKKGLEYWNYCGDHSKDNLPLF
ncbi:hypothetical protein HY008_01195 [Candidatus Woesebacteria bacterium]|nr:hypothetical protein [Candidatus Woesebacteria bacterium]